MFFNNYFKPFFFPLKNYPCQLLLSNFTHFILFYEFTYKRIIFYCTQRKMLNSFFSNKFNQKKTKENSLFIWILLTLPWHILTRTKMEWSSMWMKNMLSCSIITVLCFTLTGKYNHKNIIFSHKKHWKMFSFQSLDARDHQWTQAHGLSPTLWFVRGNNNLPYIKRNWLCHWFGNNAVRSKIKEEEKKLKIYRKKRYVCLILLIDLFKT